MPFLVDCELKDYIGESYAESIIGKPEEFVVAEKAVAAEITTITGEADPSDPATAPTWAKAAAAWFIFYSRIGLLGKIPPETMAWAKEQRDLAEASLRRHVIKAPAGRMKAQTGKVGGLIEDL